MEKGFTLLELLLVVGILAILAATATIILNPVELLMQARDSQRLGDLQSLDAAISFYTNTLTTAPLFAGTSTQIQGTCTASGTALNPFTGVCSASTSTKIDGTGWITIDFTGAPAGSLLSRLPLDPINNSAYFYAFRATSTATSIIWEISGKFESDKYKNQQQLMKNDGGNNEGLYEIGSFLVLGSLYVNNSDFEISDPLSCRPERPWSCGGVPGWAMTGDGGTFYAYKDTPSPEYYFPPSKSVAYHNGGSISQVLTDLLTANRLYTLTVGVGNRYQNFIAGRPFPGYSIELLAGGVILNSINSPNPDYGYFETAILTYFASSNDPLLGQPLEIRLTSNGVQVNWDNLNL